MTKREIPPIHPGEMLMEEFIKPYKITSRKLANNINVAEGYIKEIIAEKRNITPSLSLRLAFYFNTSPDFWMNVQQHYDLEITKDYEAEKIKKEIQPLVFTKKSKSKTLLNHSHKHL